MNASFSGRELLQSSRYFAKLNTSPSGKMSDIGWFGGAKVIAVS
jgi:hypothetical protein